VQEEVNFRKKFKVFAIVVAVTFFLSLFYNLNKINNYSLAPYWVNERIFGLSYTLPLFASAVMICLSAKKGIEKYICNFFLWICLSAFLDELFFEPFKASINEHLTAFFVLLLLKNARF
jgi:hypothetical protein